MSVSRRLFLFAALAALATQAAAASPPPKEEEGMSSAEEKEISRAVNLDGLVFPVFTADGKLKNYIFVNARMVVGPGKDLWKIREQSHFIRDAVLRAAHKTSFNLQGNFAKLDEKLATTECLKAANTIVGDSNALVSMTFTQIASQTGR
jgi:hypothetical protein